MERELPGKGYPQPTLAAERCVDAMSSNKFGNHCNIEMAVAHQQYDVAGLKAFSEPLLTSEN